MNANHETRSAATRLANPSTGSTATPRQRVLMSIGVALGLMLIAVVAGLILSSCGQNAEPVATVPPVSESEDRIEVAAVTGGESQGSTTGSLEPAAKPAPDLDATVTQSIVLPGDSVEVVARATSDAVSVTLWDGHGERQPLTYDETTNLWRSTYRVPLRASWDRLGVSVTARNGDGRWSRVWVFLNMKSEDVGVEMGTSSEPDSSEDF